MGSRQGLYITPPAARMCVRCIALHIGHLSIELDTPPQGASMNRTAIDQRPRQTRRQLPCPDQAAVTLSADVQVITCLAVSQRLIWVSRFLGGQLALRPLCSDSGPRLPTVIRCFVYDFITHPGTRLNFSRMCLCHLISGRCEPVLSGELNSLSCAAEPASCSWLPGI